jgi:hypothetical protein
MARTTSITLIQMLAFAPGERSALVEPAVEVGVTGVAIGKLVMVGATTVAVWELVVASPVSQEEAASLRRQGSRRQCTSRPGAASTRPKYTEKGRCVGPRPSSVRRVYHGRWVGVLGPRRLLFSVRNSIELTYSLPAPHEGRPRS